jgi:hypothetical protein
VASLVNWQESQAKMNNGNAQMTTKSAALLTAVMLSAILFMGVGLFSVDAGGHAVSSDGYGISTASR